jgi:hypothetical protein
MQQKYIESLNPISITERTIVRVISLFFAVNNAVTDDYRINNCHIIQINKIIVRVPQSTPFR